MKKNFGFVLQCLIALSVAGMPPISQALEPVSVSAETHKHYISETFEYFHEDRRPVSPKEILNPQYDRLFQTNTSQVFNGGLLDGGYWFRFRIQANDWLASHAKWVLELADPLAERVTLFVLKDGRLELLQQTGQQFPFQQRAVNFRNYAFPLQFVDTTPTTYYLYVNSVGAIRVPLKIWQEDSFFDFRERADLFLGLFFGGMIILTLYNLFIYLSIEDNSYLYLVLYMTGAMIFYLAYKGLGFQYVWPDTPLATKYVLAFMTYLTTLAGAQFSRSFLKTRKVTPRIDYALIVLMAACPLGILIVLVFGHAVNIVYQSIFATLAVTLVVISSGYRLLKQHFQPARFYLAAWGFVVIGVTINNLETIALIPSNFITTSILPVSFALQCLFLSFALANRISNLENEKMRLTEESRQLLRETNKQLAFSNQLKDDFLSNINHELRTPMHGVIGTLDLLKHTEMTEQQRRFVDRIAGSSSQMLHLVEGILHFTELQSDRLRVEENDFDLHRLLEDLQETLLPEARRSCLAFTFSVASDIPQWVRSDGKHIRTILSHLLRNAIKFTIQGSVKLEVQKVKTVEENLTLLSFRITDTGVGINPDKQEQIFQAFQQLDSSSTRQAGGLGIGLAICHQLSQLIGGKLIVETPDTGGCRFIMNLAVRMGEKPNPAVTVDLTGKPLGGATDDPAMPHLPPCQILVVEDSAINQMVLKSMLEKLGHNVIIAENGQVALRKLEKQPADLIFMDCQMPVMDGFEATERIRQRTGYAKTPIIAVTANVTSHDKDKCLQAGMSDYLAKPVNLSTIENILEKWIEVDTLQANSAAVKR